MSEEKHTIKNFCPTVQELMDALSKVPEEDRHLLVSVEFGAILTRNRINKRKSFKQIFVKENCILLIGGLDDR